MKIRNFILFIIVAALLGAPLLVTGCESGTANITTDSPQVIKNISPSGAYDLIQETEGNDDFVIVDVRTPGEYAGGHIAGSLNIDVNSGSFEEAVNTLDNDKTYLVYCRSGARSANASGIMAELGFTDIYNMNGGINDWISAGYPAVQ